MREWRVKHASDDLWLGLYGWSYAPDTALRFRDREDAANHAKSMRLPDGTWREESFEPQDDRRPDAQADYDPFGLGKANV